MFSTLLNAEVQSFIYRHELDDINTLVLKNSYVNGVPIARVAEQILGRKKAKEKLSTFYYTKDIIYPPAVNLEQSSSEKTAKFKSEVVAKQISERSTCADLTGGFGVDSYFLNLTFQSLHYVEVNKQLLEIARHNHLQLGSESIEYHNSSAESYLQSIGTPLDLIYIDPSRRDHFNRKMASFADCEPNLSNLIPSIFQVSRYLLVKASPLLDIKKGVSELKHVKYVYVVSVENDCKELLFFCERGYVSEPLIEAVNLLKECTDSFTFKFSNEADINVSFSEPLSYIYEPNASVLKAGGFKSIAHRFNLHKLHPNTQLYTSRELVDNFPGRAFRIESLVKGDPKVLKGYFPGGQANVMTRNYPLTPAELKIKTRLNDGGDKFLIGFRGVEKMYLAVAEKVTKDI